MEVTAFFLKYLVIFLLIAIGVLTASKHRGAFADSRGKSFNFDDKKKQELPLTIGMVYLFLGLGFFFGFLTRFLLFLSQDVPAMSKILVLEIVKVGAQNGAIDETIGHVESLESVEMDYERTIYYALALGSLWGFIYVVMGLRFMIMYSNKSHETSFGMFFKGVAMCALFGFYTFLPLFL